jgi:hypothetical protein
MKTSIIVHVLTLTTLLAGRAAGQDNGHVTLTREVVIHDSGTAALPKLKTGQILTCPALADSGYIVLCRGAGDTARIAVLPYCDEWGRASAVAAIHDSSLPRDTLQVKAPLTLRPAAIRIEKGASLPILTSEGSVYGLKYVCRDFAFDASVPKSDAVMVPAPPPEKDPFKIHEASLAKRLEANRAEQMKLSDELAAIERRSGMIVSLTRDLSQTELEKLVLKAQIARAEEICRKLTQYAPEPDALLAQEQKNLETGILDQSSASANLTKAQLNMDGLSAILEQTRKTEMDSADLNLRSQKMQAELAALVAATEDKTQREQKELMKYAADRAGQESASLSGQVRLEQQKLELLKQFAALLEVIRGQSKKLTETLASVTKEIAALKIQIESQAEGAAK